MRLLRVLAILALALGVSACAVEEGAAPAEIQRARYVSEEAPYIAVVSMVNRHNQRAAHTALFINASERVIYDPAGTFQHESMPERGDIHFGATDRMLSYYERYHARFSHYVHVQKIPVSAEVAEIALRRAEAEGPSPKLFCTRDTTEILQDVPGFEWVHSTFYPEELREEIALMPGVQNRYRYEDDRTKALPPEA